MARRTDLNGIFDDSESDAPVLPSRRTGTSKLPVKISDDEVIEEDDDDDSEDLPVQSRRKRRAIRAPTVSDANDSEDAQPSTKRRRLQPPSTPRKRSRQEDLDLEEDLNFLRPSSPETSTERRKERQSVKKSARQTALDALKRRRQKTGRQHATNAKNPQMVSDDSDSAQASEEEDEDAEVEDDLAGANYDFEEEQDNDFLVEDEDVEGAGAEIPFEFKLKLMKPRELFKFVVEWMCQKRLNPAFAIDDEVYTGAFERLNDFVRGMGGSKFQSAAWTATFLRALKARPLLSEQRFMNDGLHDRCDACNRSGHPPTFEVQFSGSPYDNDTLEEVSDGEEADAWKETELPAEEVRYFLGKFCMANARTAHALAHWRVHLYQWVEDYLEQEGYLSAKDVLQRDKWSTKKRQEYANEVVDKMEETGQIKALYRDFKRETETAQNQTQRSDFSSP